MKILRRLHSGGVSTIDVLISYIDEGDNGATRFMPLWVLNYSSIGMTWGTLRVS